jgi:hypothetical protein
VDNEIYLRQHPELQNMVSVFLFKVLEEKPGDILGYAGKFFDQYNHYNIDLNSRKSSIFKLSTILANKMNDSIHYTLNTEGRF